MTSPGLVGPSRMAVLVLCLASTFPSFHVQAENGLSTLKTLREQAIEEFKAKTAAQAALEVSQPLGRKSLPDPPQIPTSSEHSREPIVVPYDLNQLGWSLRNSSDAEHRRSLLEEGRSCRLRSGTALSGGALRSNGKVITFRVQTTAACCRLCLRRNGCAAWSWSSKTKVCSPKIASGWTRVSSQDAVSGEVVVPVPAATRQQPKPYWEPTLTVGNHALSKGFAKAMKFTRGANNKFVIRDPTGSSSAAVIKTVYPAGCWSPSANCNGGALFYAWPQGKTTSIGEAARLEYEVYFPAGFPWVKGGKLPGLTGGTGCGGGVDADSAGCMSARLMWRSDGAGEAYLYHPENQLREFCSLPNTKCDKRAGTSLRRGAFRFEHGRWTAVAITVRLNDPGKHNGLIKVEIDGDTKIEYDKMNWRHNGNLKIDALAFATWFGGSDSSWAPDRDVEAYWRNLKIYKLA